VLRSKYFIGLPQMVMNYFRFVAEEVREILAFLGVRTLSEVIGRTEYLQVLEGATAKQRKLDLAPILSDAGVDPASAQFCLSASNAPFDQGELAERMVHELLPAIEKKSGGEWRYELKNFNRSIGARLSGEIARRWGNYGMSEAPITVRCSGNAGQSFGVWNAGGLHLYLEGDANDYVGKGMAAGRVVLRHPKSARFVAKDTVIMGNTCLYGATGGELYAAGIAGERFAVRNSGAVAVLEGAGDHCCEYMTGGAVCVLGRTGVNFGAGFTGGFAYVLDLERNFVDRYNHELIDISRIHPEAMQSHVQHLEALLERHVTETESLWAREIMNDLRTYLPKFWVVKPKAASIDSLIDNLRRAA
jgi:glutamate synthase (NADPH/NADH) large chain